MVTPALHELIDLTGRTAIVTGGAVGIGAAIASRLAEAGANVMIADIDAEAAEATAKELAVGGLSALAVAADITEEADVEAMVAATVERFGAVDILVNNAGIYPNVLVMDMTAAAFERVLTVNMGSVFHCTKAAARRMIERGRGGRIINITSIDALHPSATGLATYDATKHGVWGFTQSSALELAPHRIAVNAIAPGVISTPGTQEVADVPKTVLDAITATIPMGRIGVPDDVGRVALFLASDLAAYLTGTQIVVDGGKLLS